MSSDAKPEPVPPPKLWKMRKPCRPVHRSACRRERREPGRARRREPWPPLLAGSPPRPPHQFADAVQDQVDDLLADGVVATGVVVGRVFLPGDQLLRVEELPVGPRAHLVCGGTAAGLGGRRSHPRGRLRDPPVCRPAPLLPARGSGLPGVSQTHTPHLPSSAPGGSVNPEQAPAWPVPKGQEHPGGSVCASRPHLPLHPGRPWAGPATLDGCRPDCPGRPRWLGSPGLWGDRLASPGWPLPSETTSGF